MSNLPTPSNIPLPDLLRRAREEDEGAFEELLNRYAPLINSMTAHFCAPSFSVQDREDLRQEALVAFYRALTHYNAEQGEVQFGLYAKECIRNRLISYLRSIKKHEPVLPLGEDEHAETVSGIDPAAQMVEQETYVALYEQVRSTLSEYENRVWWSYLSGRTAKEVGALLGTDEKSIQNAIYRIRRKLRSVIPYS